MANYANGKIYKIVGEDGSMYFGSTTTSLKERLQAHLRDNRTSASKIIGVMPYEMILVEDYPCESRKDLEDREGWYIRGNPCVNIGIPGRTHKEWKIANSKHIRDYKRLYYQNNHEFRESENKKKRLRGNWTNSFGDPRSTNCIRYCDPSLFA
tara:strand:+ start:83 stop:541 length:459 start_codon:yes stop_codon:yes gene_type:complete